MSAARPSLRLWHRAARALEIVTTVLFATLVLVVLWGVISRYWPGIVPSDWTEELAIHLLVWVSLLGSALTYREGGHLGVDYIVSKFDPAARRWSARLVEVCVVFFAGFTLCYGGWQLVRETLGAAGPEGLSATECSERTGLARVSARRYLEQMVTQQEADVRQKYGTAGRPERRFTLRSGQRPG